MIDLVEVSKTYRRRGSATAATSAISSDELAPVVALDRVSLAIEHGEMVAVLGPSGSGKSTLMNVLGLLDRPDRGEYRLDGRAVQALADDELARLRNRFLGFVFQSYHLLPKTTALENVELPLLYSDRADFRARAESALDAVGLADRRRHYAEELSGGQQQRVAIARAIVNEPAVLLADEPTGNLDQASGAGILELFQELHARGTTVVLITHDPLVAAAADRVVEIRDGVLTERDAAAPPASRVAPEPLPIGGAR